MNQQLKTCRKILPLILGCLVYPLCSAQPLDSDQELLRSARMWNDKYRSDIAHDLLKKFLGINPYSPEGLLFAVEMSLNENRNDEAKKILNTLRTKHPKHSATRNAEILIQVYGVDKEKLAQMRLFSSAGRKDEAAQIARDLFSNGAPSEGNLAKEYYRIMGGSTNSALKVTADLDRLYRETGDPSYQLTQMEIQLNQGKNASFLLGEFQAISGNKGVDQLRLKELWSRAIGQAGNTPLQLAAAKAFLKKFPGDTDIVAKLAAAQKGAINDRKKGVDPLAVAHRALASNDIETAEKSLETLLKTRSTDAEILGALGIVRLRQGRHLDAQLLFARANRAEPQPKWLQLEKIAEFWLRLKQADASIVEKKWAEATDFALRAVQLQPDKLEGLIKLAEINEMSGNVDAAQANYEKVLRIEPDDSIALKSLANLLSKQGQSERALELLEKAGVRSPAMTKNLNGIRSKILQDRSDFYTSTKQYEPAARLLETALLLKPSDPWLRYKLAKLYQQLGQPQEATVVMDDGVKLDSQDDEMRYARALIRSSLGDDAGVIADIDQIPSKQQTDNMRSLLLRSTVIIQIGKAKKNAQQAEIESLLTGAETMAGNDAGLLLYVANAWVTAGQPLRAVAVFDNLQTRQSTQPPEVQLQHAILLNRAKQDQVLDMKLPLLLMNPNWDKKQKELLVDLYSDYQSRKIEFQQSSGNHFEAVRLANMPIPGESLPSSALRTRTQGRLLMTAQAYDQAVDVIRQAIVQFPDDVQLRFNLGYALIKTGSLSDAAKQVQWLSEKVPKDNIGERLAIIRMWQDVKASDNAREEAGTLLVLYPDNLQVLLGLAWFERSNGQYTRALKLFQRARDLDQREAVLGEASFPTSTQSEKAVDGPVTMTSQFGRLGEEIQRGIDLIEEKQLVWIDVGQKRLQKSSTEGISTLNGWERTIALFMPNDLGGRLSLHFDQVDLSAGKLPAVNTNSNDFGQIPANPLPSYSGDVLSQSSQGLNLGAAYESDGMHFDVGFIGIGMPVTNIVGGFSKSLDTGQFNIAVDLSRRPLTGSLLSYAGAVDPVTGQSWGGVVATGLGGRVSTDIDGYVVSANANFAVITGKNVEDNTRLRLRIAVDKSVYAMPGEQVDVGVGLSAWQHAKDLSEFTWGHGGYYSPRRYLSLSLPVDWTGSDGAFTWQLRGTASVSQSSRTSSDYFPTSSALQSQSKTKVYAGSEGGGTGFSLRGAIEYRVTPYASIGGLLEMDRSDYYSPTNLLLYAKYYFDGFRKSDLKKPNPISSYSSFN